MTEAGRIFGDYLTSALELEARDAQLRGHCETSWASWAQYATIGTFCRYGGHIRTLTVTSKAALEHEFTAVEWPWILDTQMNGEQS